MNSIVRCCWTLLVLLVAAPLFGQNSDVEWMLRVGEQLNAPIARGAYDAKRNVSWLATYGALYRVADGQARIVSKRPAGEARLLLAPGGEVYAWVVPQGTTSRITLLTVDGEPRAEIRTEPAAGPAGLILGFRGNLVVTVAPLDDPEGMRGRFRYTFWSADGKPLQTVVLDSPATPILAADGSALALLSEKEAQAFSPSGQVLWSAGGAYRKGAISSGGKRAALNPAERQSIDQVVLLAEGKASAPMKLPTAVHHLAMTPSGDLIVAAGDRGRWFLVGATIREGPRLRFDDKATPYIFDLELSGPDAIVFGILLRDQRQSSWPAGSIIAVQANGTPIFRRDFEVHDASGFIPAIDATWGERELIGSTNEFSLLGRLKGGS